jgi:hypothetical protein
LHGLSSGIQGLQEIRQPIHWRGIDPDPPAADDHERLAAAEDTLQLASMVTSRRQQGNGGFHGRRSNAGC